MLKGADQIGHFQALRGSKLLLHDGVTCAFA